MSVATTSTRTSGLHLALERRGGRTAVARAEGQVPYAARVAAGRPGWARVVLVQTIAGPLAGDRISVEIDVGPGAAVEVVGNAAMLAYPAAAPARHEVKICVGEDARLAWLPEPLILAASCDLDGSVELELAAGAAAVTRELVVLGRHGELPGAYRSTLRCEVDGRPLLHDAITIDRDAVIASSPAVLDGNRAFGSLALLGATSAEAVDRDELALAGPGRVLRVLAGDAATLRARLAPAELVYLGALAPQTSS
jgi:urease accessory protein